jgi:integrase
MGRRRSTGKGLSDNLYESRGYYSYRHPVTKKTHGMGRDKKAAMVAARKLNLLLVEHPDLVQGVLAESAESLGVCIDRYVEERQSQIGLALSTLKLENYRLSRLKKDLGHMLAPDLTVKHCSDWLDGFQGDAYTKHRGTFCKVLAFSVAKGLLNTNPATETLTMPMEAVKKKRKPLSMDQFNTLYGHSPSWLRLAMMLGLITLQRRGDLLAMRYSDIQEGYLHVVQSKTEKHGLSARLRMPVTGALEETIQISRQIKPFRSRLIIHRFPQRMTRAQQALEVGQITPDLLSKTFAKIRDGLPEFQSMSKAERPTFHEIRSLGGAEYLKQGYPKEYVQRLMGHTTEKMTSDYTDQHESWTDCEAGLSVGTMPSPGS